MSETPLQPRRCRWPIAPGVFVDSQRPPPECCGKLATQGYMFGPTIYCERHFELQLAKDRKR